MIEKIIQKLSIAGQVIEDVTFQVIEPNRFNVQIHTGHQENINPAPRPVNKFAQYKEGGFFVYSNLLPADYTLRIMGKNFQDHNLPITIPSPDRFIDASNENHLFVVVKEIKTDPTRVLFDPVILYKNIEAGSPVQSNGFSTTLASELTTGRKEQAILTDVTGLTVGMILCIQRNMPQIRLKFDPYSTIPVQVTSIVGKIVSAQNPKITLEGVNVRLKEVNDEDVTLQSVGAIEVATVDVSGVKILGVERDILTKTNKNGDYILYFTQDDFIQKVTVEVSLDGYQTEIKSKDIERNKRNAINFHLIKS
ncbi:MAG: hypothetical protein ACT6FF_09150 [Methanosarcinaceae archaeon]